MCVFAMAWKAHPRWQLVVAANRDEFHERPSAPLARWQDRPEILAGRDEVSGGTWLGITPSLGRFCAVTNVSGARRSSVAPSRGSLVSGVLLPTSRAPDWVLPHLSSFSGFNLAYVANEQAWLWTNVPDPARRPLKSGIHGLSNGKEPYKWPKVAALEGAVADWLISDQPSASLLDFLSSPLSFGDLPDQSGSGAPLFIKNPAYGTRCSTVVTVTADGEGCVTERRFDREGTATGEISLVFEWRSERSNV